MSEERTYTLKEIQELREALGYEEKHTPSSTTLYAPTLQGPFQGSTTQFGPFAYPGVRSDRYSAMARPYSFASALGAPMRSEYYEELLSVLLGQTTASGTNAETWCDTPPKAGNAKECKQAFYWGEYHVKTELNAIPEIGQLRNLSDIPGQVLPGWTVPEMRNPLLPDLVYRLTDTRSQLGFELWKLGVEFERTIDVVAIAGDNSQAYTATEHGWQQEFTGIDSYIKTGYTDAKTSQVCAAMDSIVITFGADVGATIPSEPAASARNITIALTELVRAAKVRADKMGYGKNNVSWYFLMRQEAFFRIVEEYACSYATYRCSSTNAGQPFNTDTTATNALRLEMIAGQYLLVDGVPIPVVFSEGIPQTNSAGTFTSDIYLVPDMWAGRKLTYLEFFPMDNQYANEFSNIVSQNRVVLNNGLWIMGKNATALCDEIELGCKMRLIMETPFLAGRLDDVSYYFTTEIRNALPGSSFYADGPGNTVYKP